jgi:hypothetical protein
MADVAKGLQMERNRERERERESGRLGDEGEVKGEKRRSERRVNDARHICHIELPVQCARNRGMATGSGVEGGRQRVAPEGNHRRRHGSIRHIMFQVLLHGACVTHVCGLICTAKPKVSVCDWSGWQFKATRRTQRAEAK